MKKRFIITAIFLIIQVLPLCAGMNAKAATGLFEINYPFTLSRGTAGFCFSFNNEVYSDRGVDAKLFNLGTSIGIMDQLELNINATYARVWDDPTTINFEYPYAIPEHVQTGLAYAEIGLKYNLLKNNDQTGLGIYGHFDIPMSGESRGVTTSKNRFGVDLLFAHKLSGKTVLSANAGYQVNQDPEGLDIGDAFKYAAGIETPIANYLNFAVQFNGKMYTGSDLPQENPLNFILGLKYEKNNFGAALGYKDNVVSGHTPNWAFPGSIIGSVWVSTAKGEPKPVVPSNIPLQGVAIKGDTQVKTTELHHYDAVLTPVDATPPVTYEWSCSENGDIQSGQGSGSVGIQWKSPGDASWVKVTARNVAATVEDKLAVKVVEPILPPKQEFFFGFDSAELTPIIMQDLDTAAEYYKYHPDLTVKIQGHTCSIATEEYNLALGEHRAAAIKNYLTNKGISPDRLKTISYGEEKPAYDNSEESTRKMNRRAFIPLKEK